MDDRTGISVIEIKLGAISKQGIDQIHRCFEVAHENSDHFAVDQIITARTPRGTDSGPVWDVTVTAYYRAKGNKGAGRSNAMAHVDSIMSFAARDRPRFFFYDAKETAFVPDFVSDKLMKANGDA